MYSLCTAPLFHPENCKKKQQQGSKLITNFSTCTCDTFLIVCFLEDTYLLQFSKNPASHIFCQSTPNKWNKWRLYKPAHLIKMCAGFNMKVCVTSCRHSHFSKRGDAPACSFLWLISVLVISPHGELFTLTLLILSHAAERLLAQEAKLCVRTCPYTCCVIMNLLSIVSQSYCQARTKTLCQRACFPFYK